MEWAAYVMDKITDYDLGFDAGENGRFSQRIDNRHNELFCKGFDDGRKAEQARYKSRYWDSWIWTEGMERGDSARRLRDEE